ARSPAGIGVVPGGVGSGEAEKPPAAAVGPANAGRPPEVQIDTAGAPISSSRPMPVTIVEDQKGGAWDQLLRSIEIYLGLPRGVLGGQGGPGGEAAGGGLAAGGDMGIKGWWTPERMKYAADRLVKEAGLSQQGAAALVATWASVEAPGGPTSSNAIGGGHWGIGQWDKARGGPWVGASSFEDQVTHAVKELNTTETIAAKTLREAKTVGEGALGATQFERGGYGPERIPAKRAYEIIYGAGGPEAVAGGGGWNASVGDIPPDLLARVKAENPDLSPRQCVQLAQAVMGVGNVHSWLRGAGEKDLPEEVALATFGFHGESDRYALGGSGTPGINRDHSLIRVKKYPDGSFDAISQDASHPPHLVHIPWTGKGGEGDASSYYGISHAARVSQALPPTGARLAMRQPRPIVHRNLAIASIRVETHAHDAHAIAADVRLAVEREMKSVA